MADEPKFKASKDLPGWFAAIGTFAIAVIAFVTLEPIIENLEIRDRNRELTIKNEGLEQRITDQRLDLKVAETDLKIVTRQNEAASKRVENLNQREAQLINLVTQIATNIDQQIERQTALQRKADEQQAEIDRRSAANAALRAENEKLERERAWAEAAVEAAQAERDRASAERDAAIVLGRRFILNRLIETVRATSQAPDDPDKAAKFHAKTFQFAYPFQGFKMPQIRGLLLRKKGFGETILGLPYLNTGRRDLQLFGAPLFGPNDTGRDLVLRELEDQAFNVLPEIQRVRLQDEIRSFVDENDSIYSVPIYLSADADEIMNKLSHLLRLTPGSEHYDEGYTKLFPLVPEQQSPKLGEKDIAKLERELEDAKRVLENDLRKIYRARQDLHDSLDQMVQALGGTVVAPDGHPRAQSAQ